ncbi:arabinofuranosidase catalytic domain-containing protein, partial [Micromonospora sp. NPDC050980]|uniref:arabinofuranosidase catalytic domain-containing protein n=1 Tax=Micromonospora sp. NPDC050980 TaxID=3155161 RepID=UPI003410E55A
MDPTTTVRRRLAVALVPLALLVAVTATVVGSAAPPARAAGTGPCDIYAAGGTPCVAAHSTTRALYGAYAGPLYQLRRASDNATRDVAPLAAGDVANAATQDAFCAGTSCLISVIYDQTGRGNHLTQAPPGGFSGPAAGGYDNLADATLAPVTLGGRKAYGVFVAPGTGYRNNNTNGIARGDQPEGMYAIFDGTHYNGGCCFDYGNAETNSRVPPRVRWRHRNLEEHQRCPHRRSTPTSCVSVRPGWSLRPVGIRPAQSARSGGSPTSSEST